MAQSAPVKSDVISSIPTFGALLRYLRQRAQLTQRDLALAVGYSISQISRLEHNERLPDEMTLLAVFVPALGLEGEQKAVEHLFALARQARSGKVAGPAPSTISHALAKHDLAVPQTTPRLTSLHAEQPEVDALLFADVEASLFVARKQELAQLATFLNRALTGQGQVAFVVGEAGSGKTALVQEFARRAQEAHSHLIVASGNCNAYSGIGDPYLPFREILALLVGDIEAHSGTGILSQRYVHRLAELVPHAIQSLMAAGPDLIDVFIASKALIVRATDTATSNAKVVAQLKALLARQTSGQRTRDLQQQGLFVQYTQVLQTLSHRWPLILLLDDLQWADAGSLSLLFHLGRQLHGFRLLVIGIYRPDDVALGREGGRHPLEAVVNELRADFGQIQIDLAHADEHHFINALLDSQPNRLGSEFRHALWRQTGGNALFTVEMVRGLQERGDLMQDEEGYWQEGLALDWETLPARVEGVIGERLGRLPAALQAALQVASVEGEVFTAEVVAQIEQVERRELVRRLSGEVSKQHRLVQEQGSQPLGTQRLSTYRFRHILFQKYLYNHLDQAERVYLHEAVGQTLEALHQDQPETTAAMAATLAYHFQAAGLLAKAVDYLYQAGNRSIRLFANQEAIAHFTNALALLATLPPTPTSNQQELLLQLALGAQLATTRGYAAPEVEAAFARTYVLSQQMEKTAEHFPALFGLWRFYLTGAKHQRGRQLAEQCLALAEQAQDSALLQQAYHALSFSLFCLGELTAARHYLEQGIALYKPEQHHVLAFTYGTDPGVHSLSLLTFQLWFLGYPDQALARSKQALTLAEELSHPMSQAVSLAYATWLHQLRHEPIAVQTMAAATIDLCTKHGIMLYLAVTTILQGWASVGQAQAETGIEQIRQGLAGFQAAGAYIFRPYFLILLAEAYANVGKIGAGLSVLEEAITLTDQDSERVYASWVYQLKGELLLQKQTSALAAAEVCFTHAIVLAQQQGAKLLELRATTSLGRLWQRQGKRAAAHQLLTEIYGWFSEGFDNVDLQAAKALLEELT